MCATRNRMPLARISLALALLLVPACAEVQSLGQATVEQRRTMNDMQARATMAASCDISLGAYFRELSPLERQYVGLVCGGLPAAPMGQGPGAVP
jgi:hypothetical protein